MIKKIFISTALAAAMLVLSIAFGLGLIHLTNFIYYIDIEVLDIPANSGYSRDVILENYHAVMDYLSPFCTEDFHLPSMAYSNPGAIHFEECKVIFNQIYLWGAIAFVFVSLMFLFHKDRLTFRIAGVLTLALPLTVVAAIAINFDKAFVLFHKLLFNNMNWVFDPRYDPIITILPEDFFMHCGIFIALCVIVGALVLLLRRKNDKV